MDVQYFQINRALFKNENERQYLFKIKNLQGKDLKGGLKLHRVCGEKFKTAQCL